MNKYQKLNIITGWFLFLISGLVYTLTVEPTASFWDCGEFIATSYKLEVGHPPGAPLFMLLGNFFSLFALDKSQIAIAVNMLSVISAAFTIMFLHWTIYHIALKIQKSTNNKLNLNSYIIALGSGIVGALAYTFSDTFWFSAVEAEVYSCSSFFTAIVFWAIIKWDNESNRPFANKWIILICYLLGLSIGVHLLNLLAIPAITLVIYFRKYKATPKGALLAFILSLLIIAFILYGIIPITVTIAGWFELLFVNGFGLGFNSGIIFFCLLILGLLAWGIYHTYKNKVVILNTILTGILVILIGYSSYAIILIRSSADTPINESKPDNIFKLLSYLKREQYGSTAIFYGPHYNSKYDEKQKVKEGKNHYEKHNNKYEIVHNDVIANYDKSTLVAFPRIHSKAPHHLREYYKWTGLDVKNKENPTLYHNLKFFFSYQLNFMYFRYFMWNFAGRQNDIQGAGSTVNGNWISGIPFIDEARLGSQKNLPDFIAKNKGHNKYYMLPLLLGLIGLIYTYRKNKKIFTVLTLFFVFTGIAIVVYLNQTPVQPRERDYAYAGSFYAFAIWIGLGVLGLYQSIIKEKKHNTILTYSTILICFLCVPLLMAFQNWDDHDRSGRYLARDLGYNFLVGCEKNAILFCNGDNDTFPLWYNQEVEDFRTDVRCSNLSYSQSDWYVKQMKKDYFESKALPSGLTLKDYDKGSKEIVYIYQNPSLKKTLEEIGYLNIKQAFNFVASNNPNTKLIEGLKKRIEYIPVDKVLIPVDTTNLFNSKILSNKYYSNIDSFKIWNFNKNAFYKGDFFIFDFLAHNNWQRPIYFVNTISSNYLMNLENFFQVQGLNNAFVPLTQNIKIDSEKTYDLVMNKYRWGGISKKDIYLDETCRNMCFNYKSVLLKLITQLEEEKKTNKINNVLKKYLEIFNNDNHDLNYSDIQISLFLLTYGKAEEAEHLIQKIYNLLCNNLDYYFSLNKENKNSCFRFINNDMSLFKALYMGIKGKNKPLLTEKIETKFFSLYKLYENLNKN